MRATVVVLIALPVLGCRASVERGEPERTIVFQQAERSDTTPQFDDGERHAQRIEVVVADPRGGAAAVGPSPLAALVGKMVKVQFRRDLLGQSAGAPISPTAQGPGGRAVHLVGTVRSVTGGWVVLERERNTYWIPQASILLIEQAESSTTSPAVE